MDNYRIAGVMGPQAPFWLKAMRFIDFRLFWTVRSRNRCRAGWVVESYEPWVYDAFDRFERETAANKASALL
ncbi:hypothetical protein GA0061103_4397 [Rhizobium multihospitium]|uniref:Uncharacterized protein n=1 Tax=Rhizobium multihospitium TaxID=410764 RepID=A0A1C3VWJ6_9HYPH|nr:hypothetical protein GA0061103_4397 [Rhizobium multihospitium]